MIHSPNLNVKEKTPKSLQVSLAPGRIASLLYHDIFDYPLTASELDKWKTGETLKGIGKAIKKVKIEEKSGLYFLEGKEKSIAKRATRERASARKLKIARKTSEVLSRIPTTKVVAVTGALAMKNADEEEDIDLLIIVKKGTLWTTRLFTLVLLDALKIARRRYGDKDQKDKLCLNIWLDEGDLTWRARNIFTAHEIAQVKPLVNKEKAYEKFIYTNRWIKDYWPNAVAVRNYELGIKNKGKVESRTLLARIIHYSLFIIRIIEPLARRFQYFYMKPKMTREVVTPTRALFHPVDWSSVMASKLKRFY